MLLSPSVLAKPIYVEHQPAKQKTPEKPQRTPEKPQNQVDPSTPTRRQKRAAKVPQKMIQLKLKFH